MTSEESIARHEKRSAVTPASLRDPFFGVLLSPIIAAAAMSLSSVSAIDPSDLIERFPLRHESGKGYNP